MTRIVGIAALFFAAGAGVGAIATVLLRPAPPAPSITHLGSQPPILCTPENACELCVNTGQRSGPSLDKRPAPVREGTAVDPKTFLSPAE